MAMFPSCLPGCLFTLMLVQWLSLGTAPFEVLGPLEPILALVGEDSELPCYLSPNVSAEHMELRWFRNTLSPAVMLYQDGQEQEGEQMPEYQARVTLVTDNITAGHAALRIHGIRVFDEGVYGCSFKDNQARREAFLQLRVAALGSDPHISMEVLESGEIRLECTSVGWYPEPQVWWRTPIGEKFLSTSESKSPDQEGLFTVAASVIIRDTSVENVSCCVHNLLLGQQKEVGISVAAPSNTIWIFIVVAVFMGLTGIFITWQLCRKYIKEKTKDERGPIELNKAQLHAVKVTLDGDTAHSHLRLSEDSKSVRLEGFRQKLPENPERFDSWPCVLGKNQFTSKKHYWEVEVGDRTDWLLGVCRENVMKKGFILMSPTNGFWVVECSEKGYWALAPLRVLLSLPEAPCRIGIFVDYESGAVSFYNVNDGSHIYSFTNISFSGTLRPIFCLWSCGDKPLTICPVATGEPEEVRVSVDAQAHQRLLPPVEEDSACGVTDNH
ncbi:butyrophilin subfamily 1 member A1-like isoform X2 [Octodon degus]|uniref:Butyrophilin subfamily 1 member A1-like isoform X2 n=1 Tax=Octodon degus TaxID=10160 RepID=A0A6P6D6P2_OCTDE|nr:butyrophilin subfamily 1 member A1-like isoform X2 [Octodon degus]